MRNPFKRKQVPVERIFTGTCCVRQYTHDGQYVGSCMHATYNGVCPRHQDVGGYLKVGEWPPDYQLPVYDNSPWALRLRARQANHKRGNGS